MNTTVVRTARQAFFPLDEKLGLIKGALTPRASSYLTLLGTNVPFEQANTLLRTIIGIDLSKQSAWRHTLRTGEALVFNEEEALAALEKEGVSIVDCAQTMVVSVDGAYVGIRGGKKTEAKTMAVGILSEKSKSTNEAKVKEISYFSRRQVSNEFIFASMVELARRGFYGAKEVIIVSDGASWIETFKKVHCPKGIHILDFYHASEYVSTIGHLIYGEQLPFLWLEDKLHLLKHEGPRQVIEQLRTLISKAPAQQKELLEALNYLETRIGLMDYPTYQQRGWPIGSGMVESANKVVVEARLKGAGMHWDLANINPMLSLRNTFCNKRWEEGWQKSVSQRRLIMNNLRINTTEEDRLKQRQAQVSPRLNPISVPVAEPFQTPALPTSPEPKKIVNGHPTSIHPWKKTFVAKLNPPSLN